MQILSNQSLLIDDRSSCLSVTLITTVKDYLDFIRGTYNNRGGLEGQRLPLKTKTAIAIRNRMVSDLLKGAVLPPIVIGVVPTDVNNFNDFKNLAIAGDVVSLANSMVAEDSSQIGIIDGMQRTTALLEASEIDSAAIDARPVRLELWIGENTNSLIYRMLVLNTGQVPWDIKRQLETVYVFLLREIQQVVPDIQVFKIDERNRRTTGGQYQSSVIIESYFAFTSRKPTVDIKERVAEDFARLDATDSASDADNLSRFIESLRLLSALDKVFSKFVDVEPVADDVRFSQGKDVFSYRAAIVGFVSAIAVSIYGEPGFSLTDKEISERAAFVTTSIENLIRKLSTMTPDAVGEFLQLETLGLRLVGKTGGVGDFEREVFHKAFLSTVRHGQELPSMLPCWRAY